MYKEQLEKIYDLCEICKSKVNFEITKQNGILKQYLLKLGKFKLYFESNKNKENLSESKSLDESFNQHELKQSTHFFFVALNLFRSFSRGLIYFLIFLLATFSLITDLNHNEPTVQFFNFNNTLTCFFHNNSQSIIQKLREFLYAKHLIVYENFNLTKFDSKSDLINYLNTKLPFNIIMIYILSCFLILTSSKRSKSTNKEIKHSFLIWISSFLLILTNISELSRFFNNTDTQIFQNPKIKQETLFVLLPLIQITIFFKLFERLLRRNANETAENKTQSTIPQTNYVHTNRLDLIDNNLNYNPFQAASWQDTNFNKTKKLPAIEYYSKNKSIYTTANKSIYSIDSLYDTSKSIIKPAKFKPTLSSFYSTSHITKFQNNKYSFNNNSIVENDTDDDDESSIVSGITNLYLNKSKSPKFNNKSVFNQVNSNNTVDEYSFYQTNRTQNISYSKYFNNQSHIRSNSSFSNVSDKNEQLKSSKTVSNTLFEKFSLIISRFVVCLNALMMSFFLFKWFLSDIYLI